MRAWELRGKGVATLTRTERQRPKPGAGEVLVRVRAASLNYRDLLVNYRKTPDWDAAARALTGGRGVDHILEVGGATTLPVSLRALRDGGHLTLVGLLGGTRPDVADARNDRGIRVDSVFVGSVRHFLDMNEAIARAGLRPIVDRVFPFDEAPCAYQHLERGAHFGKVVIAV